MDQHKLVIYGSGGHGESVADIAVLLGYTNIEFSSTDRSVRECLGFPVIGDLSPNIYYPKIDFFVAIGNPIVRECIFYDLAQSGNKIVSLIHPNSVVSRSAEIDIGTVVMAGTVINPNVKIGKGCIINTCSSVDHDDMIDDFVHVSVGAHLAGRVHVGKRTWVGIGATISNNIDICGDCMIGAGAVVVKNIEETGTYIGIPAKKMKNKILCGSVCGGEGD